MRVYSGRHDGSMRFEHGAQIGKRHVARRALLVGRKRGQRAGSLARRHACRLHA